MPDFGELGDVGDRRASLGILDLPSSSEVEDSDRVVVE